MSIQLRMKVWTRKRWKMRKCKCKFTIMREDTQMTLSNTSYTAFFPDIPATASFHFHFHFHFPTQSTPVSLLADDFSALHKVVVTSANTLCSPSLDYTPHHTTQRLNPTQPNPIRRHLRHHHRHHQHPHPLHRPFRPFRHHQH